MSAQNSKSGGALGAIAGLLGLSVIAGLLVTAMVTPAIAVTGMAANSSIGIFEGLPSYIRLDAQAQRNTIYGLDDNGKSVPFAEIFHQNREEVAWDQVSDYVKDATVAIEDRRFFEHGGVDISSILRAAISNVSSGGIEGGASTLTMQLVKNINIMEAMDADSEALQKIGRRDAQAQTIDRKLREMKLAISLEKTYSKKEIMLGYLNIAGFGGQTYGIEAAAKQFYSTSAKDVTLAQAASLVAIVQTPAKHSLNDPDNYERNKVRRDRIIDIMLQLGNITQAEHDEAIATPVEPVISPPQSGCLFADYANFYCDYVERLVPTLESLGATKEERLDNWEKGGYEVHTALDVSQQINAEKRIAAEVPAKDDRLKLGSALSVVQPGTGRILAMAQNKTFNNTFEGGGPSTTAVNYNTDKPYGGSSGFQVGSTYKIFTLAEWLKQGHGLNESVDGRVKTYQQSEFTASCEDADLSGPPWKAVNYGGAGGSISTSVLRATSGSINSAFAAMAAKLDLCDIRDTAVSMGAHRADMTPLDVNPAAILGTNEIAPLSMAAAVATVAGAGMYCKPIAIDRIVNAQGEELPGQAKDCQQNITPEVAAGIAYGMRAVIQGGTGSASNPGDGIPLIGKTGTTDSNEHTWMVGATTKAAMAVWVGNIAGHANIGHFGLPNGGATMARHRIFHNVIGHINGEYGGKEFPRPPQKLLAGQTATVPDVSGQTAEQAARLLQSLGFTAQNGGNMPSGLDAGTVIYTKPGAGSKVSRGAVVYFFPSDGSMKETMPNVIGQDYEDARSALEDAGWDSSKISFAYTANADPAAMCRVASSSPAPGAATSHDVAVTLTVNSPDGSKPPPGLCP